MDYASRWPSTARLSRTLGFYKSNSEARAVLQGFSALRPCRTGTSSETDAEDLSALGPQIEGVDCAITMRELRPDVWKMSLRTGPRINATEACRLLGGGGHAAAAGCTVEAPWAEARERILAAVAQVAPDYQR